MSEAAIRTMGLGKMYHIGGEQERYRTLRDTLVRAAKRPIERIRHPGAATHRSETLWALRDVDLEVRHGEVLGIIGRNGAGKSTLLKVLSGITEPTEGRVEMRGRTSSLLEIGTGFHSELTGRENIYLNGSILGMKKAEIDSRFDEIVEFAEMKRFLDTPVKRYSSGMYVRLAFAVAAHLQTEILIVDEVLAVGDIAFQKKCLGTMGNAAASGKTVLLVSHNMAAIQGLCSTVLLLDRGTVHSKGPTNEVVSTYLSLLGSRAAHDLASREDRQGSGQLRFVSVEFRSADDHTPLGEVRSGDDVEIVVGYECTEDLHNVWASIDLLSDSGEALCLLRNDLAGVEWSTLPRRGRLCCRVNKLPLGPGHYQLDLHCMANYTVVDYVQRAASLSVEAGDFFGTGRLPNQSNGPLLVDHQWTLG
jgi:lipopolysaccharide transport system ATP-binding protein